jgi:hypothetical protein
MKKDLIFAPILLLVGVALFLLRFTGILTDLEVINFTLFRMRKIWKANCSDFLTV